MNTDNNGLHYFDETSKGKEIIFSTTNIKKNKKDKNHFYELLTLKDYLIKYSEKELNKEDFFNMLKHFSQFKPLLSDLPIAYYKEQESMKGIIIPYYKDSISLCQIVNNQSIHNLKKYYFHTDDELHNLYLLLIDILNILEELQDNGISYLDSNPSNFLLKDNQIKLIDFDPTYLRYESNKNNIRAVLSRYDDLVYNIHINLGLDNLPIYSAHNYKVMRKHLTKLENKIRKKVYK